MGPVCWLGWVMLHSEKAANSTPRSANSTTLHKPTQRPRSVFTCPAALALVQKHVGWQQWDVPDCRYMIIYTIPLRANASSTTILNSSQVCIGHVSCGGMSISFRLTSVGGFFRVPSWATGGSSPDSAAVVAMLPRSRPMQLKKNTYRITSCSSLKARDHKKSIKGLEKVWGSNSYFKHLSWVSIPRQGGSHDHGRIIIIIPSRII